MLSIVNLGRLGATNAISPTTTSASSDIGPTTGILVAPTSEPAQSNTAPQTEAIIAQLQPSCPYGFVANQGICVTQGCIDGQSACVVMDRDGVTCSYDAYLAYWHQSGTQACPPPAKAETTSTTPVTIVEPEPKPEPTPEPEPKSEPAPEPGSEERPSAGARPEVTPPPMEVIPTVPAIVGLSPRGKKIAWGLGIGLLLATAIAIGRASKRSR